MVNREIINLNFVKGVNDIKTHRWFNNIDWNALLNKKTPVPYQPTVRFLEFLHIKFNKF